MNMTIVGQQNRQYLSKMELAFKQKHAEDRALLNRLKIALVVLIMICFFTVNVVCMTIGKEKSAKEVAEDL